MNQDGFREPERARGSIVNPLPIHFLVLFAVVVFFRFYGSGFGLNPVEGIVRKWHPDEIPWLIEAMGDDLKTDYLYYGTAHIYLIWILNKAVYWIFTLSGIIQSGYGMFLEETESWRYLLSRWISACFSIGTLLLTRRFGRRFFSPRAGDLAFLLLGLNPVHILHAHYATVDSAFTFYTFLGLYLIWKSWEHPSFGRLISAAAVIGLTAGTKYTGCFLIVPLLGVVFFARNETGSPARMSRILKIFPVVMAAAAVFFFTNPYLLLDLQLFREQISLNIALDGAFRMGVPTLVAYLIYLKLFLTRFGALLLPLTIIGALTIKRRDRKEAILLFSYPVIYFLVVGGMTEQSTPRHMLPLLPLAALLSGITLDRVLLNLSGSGKHRLPAAALLFFVVFSQPVYNAVANEIMLAGPDTREISGNWIMENIPPGSSIIVDRNGEYSPFLDPLIYNIGSHDFRSQDGAVDSVHTFQEALEKGYKFAVTSEMIYSVNSDLEFSGYYRSLSIDSRSRLFAVFGKEGNIDLSFHNPQIKIYKISPEPFEYQTDPDGYYEHKGGFTYQYEVRRLPIGNPVPDDEDHCKQSRLLLLEDKKPLGPAHSLHNEIEQLGKGRYCHWMDAKLGPVIFFSSSDNTNPGTNGRLYEWVLAPGRPDLDEDRTFSHYGGVKFGLDPSADLVSDNIRNLKRSRVVIFENGKPLGPAHSSHEAILQNGEGRYSFWNGVMLFSSSDNTDPNKNGRSYRVLEVPSRPDMDLDLFYIGLGDGSYVFEPDSSFFGPGGATLVWMMERGEPMKMYTDRALLEPGGWCRRENHVWFMPTGSESPNVNYTDYRLMLSSPIKTEERVKHITGDIWKLRVWENYEYDTSSDPQCSRVVLFFRNLPIGPAHSDPIKCPDKAGAYIHRRKGIFFIPPLDSSLPGDLAEYEYYEVTHDPYLDPDRYYEHVSGYIYRFDVDPMLLPFIESWETLLIVEEDYVLPGRLGNIRDPEFEGVDFCEWDGASSILFSPRDISNPNNNGKEYRIIIRKKSLARTPPKSLISPASSKY